MMHNPRDTFFSENKHSRRLTGILRVGTVAIAAILQVLLIFALITFLQEYASYAFIAIEVAAVFIALWIVSTPNLNTSSRIAWLFLMMFAPLVASILYLLWGNVNINKRERGFIEKIFPYGNAFLHQDPAIQESFIQQFPHWNRITRYLESCSFPLYQCTDATYYPLGELWLEALLVDLEKAEKFIFIEMFIIEDGTLWNRVFDVLKRKAAQGVDVRVMYDDMGSLFCFGHKDAEYVRSFGIQVGIFNKVNRNLSSLYINYRNHQKITVIDGNTGYVGGTNFADEYANYYPKLGHWKDTCMCMVGDAVWSLTVFFLQMWDLCHMQITQDYEKYRPTDHSPRKGYFLPMVDGPANNPLNPGLDMYKLMLANSQEYCYITSPYLVLDADMLDSLCLSARSGVDTRIIVPHIGDHWYVHLVTQSFYGPLLEAGVKIYEYTPGYIHAKMMLSDDESGVMGSINMDFRSFYLHYEDAVWICDAPILDDIKRDMLHTMDLSEQMSLEQWRRRPWYKKLAQVILRILSPML